MTSAEFLYELRNRLSRLPQQEVEQALAYYEEFFAEAGPAGEAELIARLGTPAQVASTIISEYAMKNIGSSHQNVNAQAKDSSKGSGLKTMWIVLIAVLASPLAIPLAIALCCVVFALLIALISVFLGFFVTAIAMVVVGGLTAGVGVAGLPTLPLEGMALLGVGLVCVAVGLTLFLGVTKLCQLTIKGITWIFARLLGRKGGKK